MKKSLLVTLMALFVLLAIAGYVIPSLVGGSALAAVQAPAASQAPAIAAAPGQSPLTDLEAAYQNIYTQVNPSVVLINVVVPATTGGGGAPGGGFGGQGQQPSQQALGSGFVWDTQGDIVTNNHVIDGATQIQVTFADGTTVSGKVVGADPDSDLAVVKVTMPADQLHPVQVGDSTQLKVGQIAVAIGNPYGEQNTMTTGIISAIGRSLPVSSNAPTTQQQQGSYTIPDVIQTDAPINPGNSGGVLLNSSGQVVGVTQSIESQSGASAGIGFAIPSGIVKKVVPALISTGHFDHPYLGISGITLDPTLAQANGLTANQRGAYVDGVTSGGPAAKAGIKGSTTPTSANSTAAPTGGDVITAIAGQQVKTFDDLVSYLASSTNIGQTVPLTILRGGKEMTVQVTIAARPASQ